MIRTQDKFIVDHIFISNLIELNKERLNNFNKEIDIV